MRNVKQAFEVQESGETQEFTDDVEYLLDGLRNTEPVAIRCLRLHTLSCPAPYPNCPHRVIYLSSTLSLFESFPYPRSY